MTLNDLLELAYYGLSTDESISQERKTRYADEMWKFHMTWSNLFQGETNLEDIEIREIPKS